MRKFFVLMIASVSVTSLSAQDLIVTLFRDTIPCQIIKMDSISVVFQTVKKDGTREGRTLARQFVTYFRMGEQNVANPAEIETTEEKPVITDSAVMTGSRPEITNPVSLPRSKPEFTTFRWAFAAGYAKRLSKIPEIKHGKNEDYVELFRKFTNNFSWETELQFYLNKRNTLGLNVSGVHAGVSPSGNITIPGFGDFYNFKLRQRMIYVGPAWAKLYETNRFLFSSSLSLGVLIYTETQWPYGTASSFSEKKHSVAGGINCGIGGEYKTSSNSAIGIKIGTTLDSVSLFKIGDLNFKSQIPVSRSNLFFAAYFSFRN